jgi:hypothetical protein
VSGTEARRRAAVGYLKKGMCVIPVLDGKNPGFDDWQKLRLSPDEVPARFDNGQNVGLLTGEPSGWLNDIDLDVSEALAVADRFLPATLSSGRESCPFSHRWIRSAGTVTEKFYDLDGKTMLVELRSTGCQTLVAPSVHPCGEEYVWHAEHALAEIPAKELRERVRALATATLVARHVPAHRTVGSGGRHRFAMALSGYMLRRLDADAALKILGAAWEAVDYPNDAERKKAMRDIEGIVSDTAEAIANGEQVVGGTTLDEIAPGMVKWFRKHWKWERVAPPEDDIYSFSTGERGKNERNVLPFKTAKAVANETPREVPWACYPWAAFGAITEIGGPIKRAGKTTLVTHMIRKVLDGQEFMGGRTTKTPVLLLTEQQPTSFRDALRRADLLDRDDLHVLYWHEVAGMPWPELVARVVGYAEQVCARFVVVDTLGHWAGLRGDSENNAGAAQEALAPLQIASGKGLAVVVVRHERKGGGEVGDAGRGSSAFGGGVDLILSLRKPVGNVRPTVREIEAIGRFEETPAKLVIELTDSGYRALGSESAFTEKEAMSALVGCLPCTPEEAIETSAVVDRLSDRFSRSTIIHALNKLTDAGTVVRTGKGAKGNPYRYHKPLPGGGGSAGNPSPVNEIHSFSTPYLKKTNESDAPTPEQAERIERLVHEGMSPAIAREQVLGKKEA